MSLTRTKVDSTSINALVMSSNILQRGNVWVSGKQSRDRSYFDIQRGGIRVCVEFGTRSENFRRWPMPSCLQWFASDIETVNAALLELISHSTVIQFNLPVHWNFYIVFEPKHHVHLVPGRSWQWARQSHPSAFHGKLVDGFDCEKDLCVFSAPDIVINCCKLRSTISKV